MVTRTQYKGTTGAFVVIAMLLGSMTVYNNIQFQPLDNIDEGSIYANADVVFPGQQVTFTLTKAILRNYGIQFFMWDYHDGSYIEVSTPKDRRVTHTFNVTGEYLVSILALQSENQSRIFTIPITVIPEPQVLTIHSVLSAIEDQNIEFSVTSTAKYTKNLNYLWEFGDGNTRFGRQVEHNFTEAGTYVVRVKAYTNDSIIHSQSKDIVIVNQQPSVSISLSSSSVSEDDSMTMTAGIIDSPSDIPSMQYIWELGDGSMAQGKQVSHYYTLDGNYDIKLTAIDNNGARTVKTVTLQVSNGIPVINEIYQLSNVFTQGQTITSFANITEDASDYPFLDYDWSIEGDGYEISQPYYENGNMTVDLTITDDDGTNATLTSNYFTVANANPFMSLISAYSNYTVEFNMWGTVGSTANITIFAEGVVLTNFTLTNQDVLMNASKVLHAVELSQPLDEYWDILVDMNQSTTPFDTFISIKFVAPDGWDVPSFRTINQCSSTTTACVSDTVRIPTTPIDRGMPAYYTYKLFDPGNDDLTAFMSFGGKQYNETLIAPSSGHTEGTVEIAGYMPVTTTLDQINYWVVDENGGGSSVYKLALIDYSLLPKPADYLNKTTWEYWGHHISYYAPDSILAFANDFFTGQAYTFDVLPNHPDINSLHYQWHFGSQDTSAARRPTYTYDHRGQYLLYLVLSDGFYDHVVSQLIDVSAWIPEYSSFIRGNPFAGEELTFIASGKSNGPLTYYWDYGDGTYGFGEQATHSFTTPGNYTVILTIVDRYNQVDTVETLFGVFNAPPVISNMTRSSEVLEGNNVVLTPFITSSPYSMLDLTYAWTIEGEVYNTSSVWLHTNKAENLGELVVLDPFGDNATIEFGFNVTYVPEIISMPLETSIYGSTNQLVDVGGTVTKTDFHSISDYSIEYSLYDREGSIIDTGSGVIAETLDFVVQVNTSNIGDDTVFDALRDKLQNPEDLDTVELPSGNYHLSIFLRLDGDIVVTAGHTISFTIDADGDFITDELEVLLDNTLDGQSYSINSTDTNENGIADPVEYVIENDKDGDGLPVIVEDAFGTSDDNPDSDNDGLTDGFGKLGEMTYGSDPLDPDSDKDGLTDGEEVIGWNIELITTKGLVIQAVSSSPVSVDTDSDGVSDYLEKTMGINPENRDTDGDLLDDLEEQEYGTSLLNKDHDFDGINDYDEITMNFTSTYIDPDGQIVTKVFFIDPLSPDSDNDSISDYDEIFLYHSVATSKDSDTDGLSDDEELRLGTDIIHADTDRDGLADGIETAGFEIPVVLIENGRYGEDGSILTTPTSTNFTIIVHTSPLLSDTDGDGITDYDELMADPSNVSDPTSVDSDSDGIIDPLDPQKLVSDYTPPTIVSTIDLRYGITPGETTKVIGKKLVASLSSLWNLVKGVSGWVSNLVKSFFYWKKKCVWKICTKWPKMRSWNTIVAKTKNALRDFALNHLPQIYSTLGQFNELVKSSLGFEGMSIKVLKVAGIPYGLTISGSLTMWARNIITKMTSIIDPVAKISFTTEDNAGIDKIKVYQDGKLIETIKNINAKSYRFSRSFSVAKSGFTLQKTTIRFEIYDINGNVRVFTRTTSLKEFTQGIFEQFGRWIQETASSIVNVLEDIWDWTVGAISYLGNEIKEKVDEVAEFVAEVVNTVLNWIKSQLDKIWEGFVRETTNLLFRGRDYVRRADALIDQLPENYLIARQGMVDQVDSVLDPIMTTVNDTMNQMSSLVDEYLPPIDTDATKEKIRELLGPLGGLLDSGIIKQVLDIISGKALQVLANILVEKLKNLAISLLEQYTPTIYALITDIFESISQDISIDLPFDMMAGNLIDTALNFLDFIRNPFDTIGDLISQFTGESLLGIADNFLIDDVSKTISLYDIMKFLARPGVILGMVIGDILNMDGDIFSLRMDTRSLLQQSSIHLDAKEKLDSWSDAGKIIGFVGAGLNIFKSIASRILDSIDLQDGDRDSERAAAESAIDIIFMLLADLPEIIDLGIKIGNNNATQYEKNKHSLKLALFILKIVKSVVVITGSLALMDLRGKFISESQVNSAEKILTIIALIFSSILDFVDIVVGTIILVAGKAGEQSVSDQDMISTIWSMGSTLLNAILDIVVFLTQGGSKLGGYVLLAYVIANIIVPLFAIGGLIVDIVFYARS